MRRWAVITLFIAAIAAHATPARAATSSTYTQYATPRTLTAGELAVLDCDAAPLGVFAAGTVALGSLLAFAGRRRRGER